MEGRARADCGSNLMERSYSRERSKFVRGFKRNHFLLSTASKGSCCDNYDGRAAGDAGGAVLRLRPRAACPRQPHASQDRPFRRPVGSEGASGALLQRCGRPSIDPELMMRMLIVGYCFGIRSEHRLWLVLPIGLDADVPDHSTFSKNRRGRFRESDLLRKLFETVIARCTKEGRRSFRSRRQHDRRRRASTAKRRQGRRPRSDVQSRSRGISVRPRRRGLRRRDAGRAEGDLANRSRRPAMPTRRGSRQDARTRARRPWPPAHVAQADTQGIDKRPVSAVMMLDWLSTFRANTTARTCL
jgi:Transposase domain (DUF772)